jgi:hypothetical protein
MHRFISNDIERSNRENLFYARLFDFFFETLRHLGHDVADDLNHEFRIVSGAVEADHSTRQFYTAVRVAALIAEHAWVNYKWRHHWSKTVFRALE